MGKSGEKLEGINGADLRPRTGRAHESSRSQVLRFSASLNHRCHFLVGSENHSRQFAIKLAQITKARQGQAEGLAAASGLKLGGYPQCRDGNREPDVPCWRQASPRRL